MAVSGYSMVSGSCPIQFAWLAGTIPYKIITQYSPFLTFSLIAWTTTVPSSRTSYPVCAVTAQRRARHSVTSMLKSYIRVDSPKQDYGSFCDMLGQNLTNTLAMDRKRLTQSWQGSRLCYGTAIGQLPMSKGRLHCSIG